MQKGFELDDLGEVSTASDRSVNLDYENIRILDNNFNFLHFNGYSF